MSVALRHISTRHTLTAAWRTHIGATLIVLVGLAFGAVFLLNVANLLAPPRVFAVLGWSTGDRARIAWVRPGSTLWDRGIRAGDVVQTVDGRPPRRGDRGLGGIWRGRRLVVRQATGETVVVVAAEVAPARTTWPLLLLSPWFFLLGLLVVLRAPTPPIGRAAYAFCATTACALALAPAADGDEPLAAVAEFALVTLFAATFVLFFLTFPIRRGTTIRRGLVVAPAGYRRHGDALGSGAGGADTRGRGPAQQGDRPAPRHQGFDGGHLSQQRHGQARGPLALRGVPRGRRTWHYRAGRWIKPLSQHAVAPSADELAR